ncbi:MAG: radical SAM protein [Acidobacteriota bacterium]|nr:radical SAM protein [Acidobacteriota bacterium]
MAGNPNRFSCGIHGGWRDFRSAEYNYRFNLKNGFFARWGRTPYDDPHRSPFGPEIADIEISSICCGVHGKPCAYCYKGNTGRGKNMSLETFTAVIGKINGNRQLTQVAFGLGAAGTENPALWDMCAWLRDNNIVPNGTVADITDETADKVARFFGACAVSDHFLSIPEGNEVCYDNVRRLTDRGMSQVNIHYVLARETYENAFQVLRDVKNDERLRKINALVFLSVKRKGRALKDDFQRLTGVQFTHIIRTALDMKVNIGFDSCAFPKFASAIKGLQDEKYLLSMAEGCESFGRFSLYVNVDGRCFPCSFCEGVEGWADGLDILSTDFLSDVWNGADMRLGREKLAKNNGDCPIYEI